LEDTKITEWQAGELEEDRMLMRKGANKKLLIGEGRSEHKEFSSNTINKYYT
jgi:hypothetical protein